MSSFSRILALLAALLTVLVAMQVTRLIDEVARPLRVEIASARTVSVGAEARRRLASLPNEVVVTYFVSDASSMPSHMRHLRRDVQEVLAAMARHAEGRLRFEVVDPSGDETLEILAARHRAAPFRVRTITRDGHDERTVWSSLTIASGPHPVAVINGIEPQTLPDLQSLILRHVEFMSAPRAPVFALAGTGSAGRLAGMLAGSGEVIEIDLSRDPEQGGSRIPARADVLFWLDPETISPARLREIERFVESGRSIVVAGSRLRPVAAEGRIAFEPVPYGLETLLAEFGLSGEEGLVTDRFTMRGAIEGFPPRELPFLVRCLPSNQDFSRMRMAVNGNVIFAAPTPFVPVGPSGDWRVETLMSLSDGATVHAPPAEGIPFHDLDVRLAPESGTLLARQPLAVRIRSLRPGPGEIIALAASTPLRDEWLAAENVAHPRMVMALVQSLAEPQRLVQIDARPRSADIPADLPVWKRLTWRIIVFASIPLLIALIAWRRGLFRVEAVPAVLPGKGGFDLPRLARGGLVVAGIGIVLLGGAAMRRGGDLTESQINALPRELVALGASVAEAEPIVAEVIFTDSAGLPPRVRGPARAARHVTEDLARAAGRSMSVRRVRPDRLSEAERLALVELGAGPVEMVDRDEEVVRVRRVYASIVLRQGERAEVVRFSNEAAFGAAPLRLAIALRALRDGSRPHVVVASDVPRLTPAEAHELYQQRGLTAPLGTDVYARARRLLEETGLRVTHVVPREPAVPSEFDAILWLQPRRPAAAMLDQFSSALSRGVPGMIAMQHFNMQARQYPGRGYSIVYWPQPQFPEIHQLWLERIGVRLPREVLFDEVMLALPAESQIYRGDQRELREQASALPFLIRAVRDNMALDAPMLAGVGDLALPWAAPIEVDEAQVRELEIDWRPLIRTSPRTWSFAWSGGFLPPDLLMRRDASGEMLPFEGSRVLAASFSGPFPRYRMPPPGTAPEEDVARPLEPARRASRLIVLGCSELFKDHRLFDAQFPADQLLVSSVLELLDDPVLSSIAARRPAARGFEAVETSVRTRWRVIVLAAVPMVLLLTGLLRSVRLRFARPLVTGGAAA